MKIVFGFIKAVLLLAIFFVIGFVAFNVTMLLWVGHSNEEKTPEVIGMSFETARQVCKKNNLYLEQIDSVINDEFPKGRIVSQEPNPGIMTKRFRTVKVVVSQGPEMTEVPYLDNLSISQAKLKLENAGLILGEINPRYSDEVKKDKVIISNPLAGSKIPRNGTVDIEISLGKMQDVEAKKRKYEELLKEETP